MEKLKGEENVQNPQLQIWQLRNKPLLKAESVNEIENEAYIWFSNCLSSWANITKLLSNDISYSTQKNSVIKAI